MFNVTWIIFIAAVLNFSLGVFVLLKSSSNKLNSLFALFCFVASFIGFIDFSFRFYPHILIIKEAYAFSAFLPFFALSWIYKLEGQDMKKSHFLLLTSVSLAVFCISLFTDFIVEEVYYLTSFGHNVKNGFLFPGYSLFLSTLISIIIYKLYIIQKRAKSIKKIQARYALLGVSFYSIIASFATLILPSFFNIYSFTALDSPSSLFFVGFSTYAILRYRLFGIRVLASKLYFYFIIAVFSFLFFHVAFFVKDNWLGGVYTMQSLFFGFFIAIFFALVATPFIDYIQRTSDTIFFKGLNPSKVIKDFVIRLNEAVSLEELFVILQKEFERILKVKKIDILIFDEDKNIDFEKSFFNNKKVKYSCKIKDVDKTSVKGEIEATDKDLYKEFDKYDVEIILPLYQNKEIIGLIVMGKKISGEGYTREDIDFLELSSFNLAVVIENAKLYSEIEDFNENLQKKVDEQTKDIRRKARRLKKLLIMRSEFLDIASHQLRTPVSVIKGMLSMIIDGSAKGKKKDEFLKSCMIKSLKLEQIINDILHASEMDSDKFEINLRPTSVGEVMENIYKEKKEVVKAKKIKLKLDMDSSLPLINSDSRYLNHAIRNLVNNAIQYTPKGEVSMSVKRENGFVVIRVADSGVGIPAKNVDKIFNKFTRGENAMDVYTDGSGLGLFIVKRIVNAHPNAEIHIEKTEINKGTVFVMKFPILK